MANTKPMSLYDSCVASPYSRSRDRVVTESGSQIQKTYKLKIEDDGTHSFAEVGTINIYDKIQSHRESTDLALMIKRFEQGDETALERIRGFYMDTIGMPKTLAETLQMLEDSKVLFESLPVELRDVFNHNPDEFLVKLDSYMKKIEKKEDVASETKEVVAPATEEKSEVNTVE